MQHLLAACSNLPPNNRAGLPWTCYCNRPGEVFNFSQHWKALSRYRCWDFLDVSEHVIRLSVISANCDSDVCEMEYLWLAVSEERCSTFFLLLWEAGVSVPESMVKLTVKLTVKWTVKLTVKLTVLLFWRPAAPCVLLANKLLSSHSKGQECPAPVSAPVTDTHQSEVTPTSQWVNSQSVWLLKTLRVTQSCSMHGFMSVCWVYTCQPVYNPIHLFEMNIFCEPPASCER